MEPIMSNLSLKVKSYELNTWDYLKEGMPISFTGTIKSYSPSGSIEVLINRKRNNEESDYVPLGPASFLWVDASMSAKPGSPNSHSYSN
jgi:antitoxin component YwqK of YwqJK toxin-antitoxin module